MKGDFTRSTFRRERHYSGVRMQQGRVQLDADWNEQLDIQAHRGNTTRLDVIGPCGGPLDNAGFEVQVQAGNLQLGAGRYYVNGILCENEQDVLITEQPDLPGFVLPTAPGVYLAYLDVWERHLSYLQAPEIREVALGGPDTATRTKTVWQTRLLRVGDVGAAVNCLSDLAAWDTLVAPSSGQLRARAQPGTPSDDPCILAPGAGFRRLENQLYRVEIHEGGTIGSATFKWSRENGSIAARVESIVDDEITISAPGRDLVLGFAPGQWVELTDERNDLAALPGTLVRISNVDGRVLTVDTATATGPLTEADFPLNPKLRRWESVGALAVEVPAENDGFIALEDGVEVKFEAGSFRTGDYWQIPARTLTGEIEWPVDGIGQPIAREPHGIRHHFCRLALVEAAADGDGLAFTVLSDCRSFFPPITQLIHLFYVSGDGQEALHDPTQAVPFLPLAQPLQVGVSLGQWPVEGATIRFTITEGNGRLQGAGASVDIATGPDGIATCTWELDPGTAVQEVEATLRDANGDQVHLPVRFSARLVELTSLFYVSGDGQEVTPDPTQPTQLLPLAQPLQAGVSAGTQPVQGATVRFAITQGNGRLQGAGASVDVPTGADGVATCTWELDSTTPSQQVQATLLDTEGASIHLPVRYTANLSLASQVAYDPSACPNLEGAVTVQEAIDRLCEMGGADEPGVVIRELRAGIPNFDNDVFMPVGALVEGIHAICDRPVDPATIGQPTCFVTLDLPYPFTSADMQFWNPAGAFPPILGFEPLILAGQAEANGEVISWKPSEPTAVWLQQQLFPMMKEFNRGDRILTHLTIKGNFIWAEDDPDLFLDGEAFGMKGGAAAPRTALRLPSGNGRRGGDFEMWFWLVEALRVEVRDVVIDRTRVVGGNPARGTVTLTSPAPEGGMVVNLVSTNPELVEVPTTVTIPAGETSATFDVRSLPTEQPGSADIEASMEGGSRRTTLNVRTR